jgi:hypothetical protein
MAGISNIRDFAAGIACVALIAAIVAILADTPPSLASDGRQQLFKGAVAESSPRSAQEPVRIHTPAKAPTATPGHLAVVADPSLVVAQSIEQSSAVKQQNGHVESDDLDLPLFEQRNQQTAQASIEPTRQAQAGMIRGRQATVGLQPATQLVHPALGTEARTIPEAQTVPIQNAQFEEPAVALVVVRGVRQAREAPNDLDRIGRGNSITIQLPSRS